MDDLVKLLRQTPIYEGNGEESDLPEQAAERIEALERQVKAADEMAAMARKVCAGAVNPRTGGRTILERDVVALQGAEGDYTAAKEGGA